MEGPIFAVESGQRRRDAGGQGNAWLFFLSSMILPTGVLVKGGLIAAWLRNCMRYLVTSFSAAVSKSGGRDSGLVIRSRGRWGKCG